MNNELQITKVITDMFLGFPAASKTSADQVRVYVQEFTKWPASVVARAIKSARKDPKRNMAFPPSIDEINAKLMSTGMSPTECEFYKTLNNNNQTRRLSA